MNDITAIILTKNEEANIERCINSIKNVVDRICVVDSGSTDRTIELAKELGADAVIDIKYGSSQVMSGAAEVIAYGTAVKILGTME